MEAKGAIQTTPTKRLLFDCRYGWVIDEWKSPTDEALSGGRGMFCILPLAKGLIQTAAYSVNMVTNTAVNILEKRDELSLQHFPTNVGIQLQQLGASVSKPVGSLLAFKDNLFLSANGSSLQHTESNNLQEPETA